jgi:hypothetical protein
MKTFFILPVLFIISFQGSGQKLPLFERIKNAEKIPVVKDFMLLDPSLGASYVVAQYTSARTSFALLPKDYDRLTAFIAETLNKQFSIQSAQVVDNKTYIADKDIMSVPGRFFVFDGVDEDLFVRVIYIINYYGDPTAVGEFKAMISVTLNFFADEGKKIPKAVTGGKFLIGNYSEDLGPLRNLPNGQSTALPNIEYFLNNDPPTRYIDAVKVTIPEGINKMYVKLEKKAKKKKKKK